MLRLDAFVRRHRRAVIAVWVLALVAALPFALRQSDNLTGGGFEVPGSQSQRVQAALQEHFPGAARASLAAVLLPRRGATEADVRARLALVRRAARQTGGVDPVPGAGERALAALRREPGRPLVVPLAATVDDQDASDVAGDLRDRLGFADGSAQEGAVAVHLIGQGALWAALQDQSTHDLETAERTGFPIVALVLIAVFGSLAAAALPLALGLFSVLITGALIFFLSQATQMSVFVTSMASMIGIGVAVDYSLFVLARYREEVRAGRTPEVAQATAIATSGVAVLFSGVTVIVALAGLFLVPTTAIRSMALGAILVVAVSMLASATLLPALVATLGRRAYARGRLFLTLELVRRSWRRPVRGSTRPDAPATPSFWARWTDAVMRRPVASLVASAAVLLVLAIPTLSLETGNGALRQFPDGHETPVGFAAAASVSAPGDSAPVRIVVGAEREDRVQAVLRADPEVLRVAEPVRSPDGRSSLLVAVPRHDGESDEAKALVSRLREALPEAEVGGSTAMQRDFADTVSGSMWKIVLFVLGLSFVVLLVLLRSVVLPLKAIVMNLLSVGASYGVLVAVFQWGWVDGFLGFESAGYIDTLTPPLVLAVVFGLSMDYEV
ncbi:MAG TPA: MMPL family transporter, partial [Baekduia sp.]|nr:MMPL family transporter [Baekduia sp.]